MQGIEEIARTRVFGGTQRRYRHVSSSCDAPMTFSVFLPASDADVPVLYWLSGLTCNDENFLIKAGAQRVAAELGIALVAPDTSPRDTGIDGEDDDWDLGTGAGFYVNATQAPWAAHYRMFDYVADELPSLIRGNFPVTDLASISGHSMGGHGALVTALRRPDAYASVSAFAPIVNPTTCPWGIKAFSAYLGDESRAQWREYDACELLSSATHCPPLLVDQGDADEFLEPQLRTERLQEAAGDREITLRMQPGYDHSYYFIATFIAEHLRFHHASLQAAADVDPR